MSFDPKKIDRDEVIKNLEKLGMSNVYFSHAGKYDRAKGASYGDEKAEASIRAVAQLSKNPVQVSAGYATFGHSNGRGGEHVNPGVWDWGQSNVPMARRYQNELIAQRLVGKNGYIREDPGGKNDHIHFKGHMYKGGNTYNNVSSALGPTQSPALQLYTPPDYAYQNWDPNWSPGKTLNKGTHKGPAQSFAQPTPAQSMMVPNPLYKFGSDIEAHRNAPEPTNLVGDFGNAFKNVLSGYTDDQAATHQGHGVGSFAGDLTANAGAMLLGAAGGGAAASVIPGVGTGAGAIGGGMTALGGLGAAREAQRQRLSGEPYDLGAMAIHGGINAVGAIPIGGPVAGGLVRRAATGFLTHAPVGVALDVAAQAAEQKTFTPNVDVGRAGASGALLGGLGAVGSALHGGRSTPEGPRPHLSETIPAEPYGRVAQPEFTTGREVPQPRETLTRPERILEASPTGETVVRDTVRSTGENPAVLNLGEGKTTFPESFRVAGEEIKPTTGQVDLYARPGSPEGLPPRERVTPEIKPTAEPVVIETRASRAKPQASQFRKQEFYTPDEVTVITTGNKGRIEVNGNQYDPATQVQVDALRSDYKARGDVFGADRDSLYKEFVKEHKALTDGRVGYSPQTRSFNGSEQPNLETGTKKAAQFRDLAEEIDAGNYGRYKPIADTELAQFKADPKMASNIDVLEQTLRKGEVSANAYVGNRTSAPEQAMFTPVALAKDGQGNLVVKGVNSQGHYVPYKLNQFEGPIQATGKRGYTVYDYNMVNRTKGIHTETYRAEKGVLERAVEARPDDKDIARVKQAYDSVKTVKDLHSVRTHLERLERKGKLSELRQALEDAGIGRCK